MSIDEKKLAAILWKLAAMMYECKRMTADNANLVVSGHSPAYDTDAFGAIFTLCAKELAPSINELLNDQPAIKTLPTHGGETWQPVPETLPPDPEGGWYSPIVWLALSDGRVLPGQALHRATTDVGPLVRDWFFVLRDPGPIPGRVKVVDYLGSGVTVVAWKPIATPDHPRSNE